MIKKQVTYEKAIVTFLDILGFKERVKELSANEIYQCLFALNTCKPSVEVLAGRLTLSEDPDENKPMDGILGISQPIVYIFSDTIVRIRPIETDENREYKFGHLFHELRDLVYAQISLLQDGILLRGAISFGEVYSSETQVFGPAIVRAYELENQSAIYPRIILDPKLLQEFEMNELLRSDNPVELESDFVYKQIKEGEDGFWFVDYLGADIDTYREELLNIHKNIIIEGANNPEYPTNVVQKYMWLAHYQNSLVESFSRESLATEGVDIDDLFITERDVPTLHKPL